MRIHEIEDTLLVGLTHSEWVDCFCRQLDKEVKNAYKNRKAKAKALSKKVSNKDQTLVG